MRRNVALSLIVYGISVEAFYYSAVQSLRVVFVLTGLGSWSRLRQLCFLRERARVGTPHPSSQQYHLAGFKTTICQIPINSYENFEKRSLCPCSGTRNISIKYSRNSRIRDKSNRKLYITWNKLYNSTCKCIILNADKILLFIFCLVA